MDRVIEECTYDTYPVVMEECVNDELDYDYDKNEENETKVNYKEGDDTQFKDKEGHKSTENES